MKKLLIAFAAGALLIGACKEDEKEVTPPTNQAVTELTGKNWQMMSNFTVYTKGTKDSTYNEYATMDACEKDDLINFNTNKTITTKAGATKCNPTDPDTEPSGTWELSADNKKLTITNDGVTLVFNVQELAATNLTLVYNDTTDTDFDLIKTTVVFIKK